MHNATPVKFDRHWFYQTIPQTGTGSTFRTSSTWANISVGRVSKTGTKNPRRHFEIQHHVNASTNYSTEINAVQKKDMQVSGKYYTNCPGVFCTENLYSLSGPPPFLTPTAGQTGPQTAALATALKDANAKLIKKLKQRQTTTQSGVFLGELRETLRMIKNPAKGMLDFLRGEQFKRYKKARRQIDRIRDLKTRRRSASVAVSDLWLQAQFGIKPFLGDCEDAKKAYEKIRLENPDRFVPFSSTASSLIASTRQKTTFIDAEFPPVTHERLYRFSNLVIARIYGETRDTFNGPAATIGLTWGDFVPTLWEVLPFSFLVDYWTNVGDILNGCSVDLGRIARCSSVTVHRVRGANQVFSAPTISSSYPRNTGNSSESTVYIDKIRVSRQAVHVAYIPHLEFGIPRSPLKWANMGALVQSIYPRMGR